MPPAFSALPRVPGLPAVAIIPARYNSTRLPGKVLADIAGRPMIEHVYRRTAASRLVGRVIVATDDERICRAVEAFGGCARVTDASHRSGTDRLAEVAQDLDCEIVVNVQGDEPLVEPEMIEQAITAFADRSVVMSTLRRRLDDPRETADPNVVKVVVDQESRALYFSRAPIPFVREAGAGVGIFKHIGLYVYRREFLLRFARLDPTPLERAEGLEQLRALEHGYSITAVETAYDSLGVDTPDDLERVRRIAAAEVRG